MPGILVILAFATAWCLVGFSKVAAGVDAEPLVIYFQSGKATLSDTDRQTLRRRLGERGPGNSEKILVIGHTDSSGSAVENLRLSRLRAEAVRKEIVAAFGVSGRQVIAIGKADTFPSGDNRSRKGRAQNRRVEVYLARLVSEPLKGGATLARSDRDAVASLVMAAGDRLRERKLDAALRLLHTARDRGGEQLADWHAMFAIVGYYSGAPVERIRNHLRTALEMDPFHGDARDFLGRLTAQERFAAGRITPAMGREANHPIIVESAAEIHEYLRQFAVQPLDHGPTARRSVEVWTCRNADGEQVRYYFQRTGGYGGAG